MGLLVVFVCSHLCDVQVLSLTASAGLIRSLFGSKTNISDR